MDPTESTESNSEIPIRTCSTCSQILVPQTEPEAKITSLGSDLPSLQKRMIEQLCSDAGIAVHVSRRAFREAVQGGCTICVALYGFIQANDWGSRFDAFQLGAEGPQRRPGSARKEARVDVGYEDEDGGERRNDRSDDEVLTIRFHATTTGYIHDTYSRGEEQAARVSPLDIKELHVVPFEQGNAGAWFDVFALPGDPAAELVTSRPVNPETGTRASVEVAKAWIQQCLQSHPNCSEPQALPPLPTRVIDVGDPSPVDVDGQQSLKLVITNGQPGRYAALSYCWGGQQPITLTAATLERLQHGMPLADFPPTIRDAVWWTQQLSFRYLWIDALCILQDSPLDKAREISIMDAVYASAFITFAAAKAPTTEAGFRQPSASSPTDLYLPAQSQILYPCPNGSTGKVFVQETRTYRPGDEPLNQRGWALQEALLSRRVLTFGSAQMYWVCQSKHAANGGKMDAFDQRIQRLSQDVFAAGSAATRERKSVPPVQDPCAVRTLWKDIAEQYSARQLSHREDRLPALAALAASFQRALGGETYLAGLWARDFPESLAWHVVEPQARTAGRREGPTWSWACVGGEVFWMSNRVPEDREIAWSKGSVETRVLAHDVRPKYAAAPLGEVESGTITLRGKVKAFEWDGESEIFDSEENRPDFIGLPDAGEPLRNGEHHVAIVRPDFCEEVVRFKDTRPGEDEMAEVAFQMGQGKGSENKYKRRVAVVPVSVHAALLLERHGCGQDRGEDNEEWYTRLGLVEFDFVEDIGWEANLCDFFEGCEERTLVLG